MLLSRVLLFVCQARIVSPDEADESEDEQRGTSQGVWDDNYDGDGEEITLSVRIYADRYEREPEKLVLTALVPPPDLPRGFRSNECVVDQRLRIFVAGGDIHEDWHAQNDDDGWIVLDVSQFKEQVDVALDLAMSEPLRLPLPPLKFEVPDAECSSCGRRYWSGSSPSSDALCSSCAQAAR